MSVRCDVTVATVSTRTPENNRQLQINNYDFSQVGNLLKKSRLRSSVLSWCLKSTSLRTRRCCLIYITFRITYRLANCAYVTSANLESMKTNSTMLGLVTCWKKRMMTVDILLRNIQPKWCLSTQDAFGVKDQTDYVSASFHFVG